MVYQLLKDIVQLLDGKESLTAAERSILKRSSQALATMRNSEDTELLKQNEILVRFCPATKSPVLVYYDGDGMCSCMHNDTIAEDIEDVKRWLEDATTATPNDTMSYQTEETVLDDILSSEENCETFMNIIFITSTFLINRYVITPINTPPRTPPIAPLQLLLGLILGQSFGPRNVLPTR